MGIDAARYANNDDIGIAVGNFANEMTSFYVAQAGSGLFSDESIVSGVGAASRRALSFGLFFFDYDLDGRLDLLQANGHVEDEINSVQPQPELRAAGPAVLELRHRLPQPVPARRWRVDRRPDTPLVGRGAAYADIDRDGDLDVVITQPGARAAAVAQRADPRATTGCDCVLRQSGANRDAIGARLEITSGDRTQYRFLTPGKSYLSHVEFPLTVGLGREQRASVAVTWPDGTRQVFPDLAADQAHESGSPLIT